MSGLAAGAALPSIARAASAPTPAEIGAMVRAEFLHAWNGYKRFAWGHDEVRPVSGTASEFFIPGHSLGLSVVESMDTHYVMGLDSELADCVAWLR
ncbi:MAG: glycoside hydrolase family 47 protein, partial [Rhodanobacteraceae bacterium]